MRLARSCGGRSHRKECRCVDLDSTIAISITTDVDMGVLPPTSTFHTPITAVSALLSPGTAGSEVRCGLCDERARHGIAEDQPGGDDGQQTYLISARHRRLLISCRRGCCYDCHGVLLPSSRRSLDLALLAGGGGGSRAAVDDGVPVTLRAGEAPGEEDSAAVRPCCR